MANLKIIRTTGSPFTSACRDKIAYETSSNEWNVYRDGSWSSQTCYSSDSYRPATAEEIAEHWKVLYPKWTPEPGDRVIVTQDIGKWCNKKGTIVEAHGADYWVVKRDYDGHTCNFRKEDQMILAPYQESVKPVEATEPTSPESKHGFTIGDIVIPKSDNLKNRQCIVKALGSSSVGVYCPSGVGLGHTLDGHCPDNTGWWYHPSQLDLVSKEEPMDLTKIIPGVGSFKVGDKVVAHSKLFDGCTGTIVCIHPDAQPPLGVQFEKYHSTGHTLDGNCPIGYGWYYDKSDLTLVVEDKSLSKPSTPSIPPPKEGFVTLRFFTEEEFKAKGLWNSKGYPEGWNNDGEMNKYLGTYIQLGKYKLDGSSSFRYEDWYFAANNYEVIHEGVEPKPEPKKPEVKPQRFKVGDQVTYKSIDECGGRYRHGGSDQGGFLGTITSYNSYYSENGCYGIQVTCKDGCNYTMIESEFREYDGIYPGAVTSGTSTGAVALKNSSGADVLITSAGTSTPYRVDQPWTIQLHSSHPQPQTTIKDNLAEYQQAPLLISKKPKRSLIVVDLR